MSGKNDILKETINKLIDEPSNEKERNDNLVNFSIIFSILSKNFSSILGDTLPQKYIEKMLMKQNEEMQKIVDAISNVSEQYEKNKVELANLNKKLTEKKEKNEELKRNLEKILLQIEKMKKDTSEKENELANGHNELEKLKTDYKKLINKIEKTQQEINKYVSVHENNLNVWEKYFNVNKQITDNLNIQYQNDEIISRIRELEKLIQRNLEQYDNFLQAIVKINETKPLEEIIRVG